MAASEQGAGRWCSGKASCPEVSKDQPAACTGLGGEELDTVFLDSFSEKLGRESLEGI